MLNKNLLYFIRRYLANRPAFFAFLRPTELELFLRNRKLFIGKIMDFGCGDGFFASLIFKKNQIEVGLDLCDSAACRVNKKNCYKIVKIYDGIKIPFKKNTFDTIFSNSVFEHIVNLEQNLNEINRVLKIGGKLVVTVMTDNWEKNLFGTKIFGNKYLQKAAQIQVHHHLYSRLAWKKQFQRCGFKILSYKTYLPVNLVRLMELAHFISAPSLLSFFFFKKWVVWPKWYFMFNLDKWILSKLNNSELKTDSGAAAFFILEKRS